MASILIRNAKIIDGAGSAPFKADVELRDGKIAAIGDVIAESPGRRVIDAAGKTLMPGLIDAHCHISFDEPNSNDELFFHRREGLAALVAAQNARKLLRAGVTGILDADCIFDTSIDLRDAIEAGVCEGPRMAVGGNALLTSVGGTAGRLLPDEGRRGYGRIVRSRDEIVNETRRQIKNGVDWTKVHVTGLTPRQKRIGEIQVWSYEELRTVVDTAHELETPVVGHCRSAGSTRDSARAGLDLILHATYMDDEALEAVVEAGTPIVPTLTFLANLADYGELTGASPEIRDVFKREIEESADMLRKVYDAGVPLLCGTESGFSITPYGEWHYRELEVFVKYLGMSPLEAIKCYTSECGRALGLDAAVGAIAVGQLADLIIVDGDPSRDVTILGDKSNIKHVFVGGVEADITPPSPRRRQIPDWRVINYGAQILTWEMAQKTCRK